MQNLYYRIWADVIKTEQAKKAERKNWKLYAMVPVSALMGINLFTFFYWMKVLVNRNLPLFIPVDIFSYHTLNSFVAVLITFFVPFVIFNYLVLFYNDRYKKVLVGYEGSRGKLYNRYALLSLGGIIIPVVVAKAFF